MAKSDCADMLVLVEQPRVVLDVVGDLIGVVQDAALLFAGIDLGTARVKVGDGPWGVALVP